MVVRVPFYYYLPESATPRAAARRSARYAYRLALLGATPRHAWRRELLGGLATCAATLLAPPDFLISPCARRTRRKLRRGWPTAKRRRQPLPRRRECSPCVKYRAHGEHICRVLFIAHGEIKITNGVGPSLRRRGQLRRVLAV